jgi:hypothetical protein
MEFDIFRYVLIFLTYFGHNPASPIPDRGQVALWYEILYTHARQGKVRKMSLGVLSTA